MADKDKVGMYVDIAPVVRFELEKIAFSRSRAGHRVTLRAVVTEALNEFIARYGVPDDGDKTQETTQANSGSN